MTCNHQFGDRCPTLDLNIKKLPYLYKVVRFNNITKYCSVNNFKEISITEEGFQKMNWYKSNVNFFDVRLLYLYKFNKIHHNIWVPFQNPHSVVKIEKDEIVGVGNLDGGYRLIYYNNTLSLTTHTPAFFLDWADITKKTNRSLKLKEI